MLNVPVAYFGDVIQRNFELAGTVSFFAIVLVSQYCKAENGENRNEVN
jgi:hypothetical protein